MSETVPQNAVHPHSFQHLAQKQKLAQKDAAHDRSALDFLNADFSSSIKFVQNAFLLETNDPDDSFASRPSSSGSSAWSWLGGGSQDTEKTEAGHRLITDDHLRFIVESEEASQADDSMSASGSMAGSRTSRSRGGSQFQALLQARGLSTIAVDKAQKAEKLRTAQAQYDRAQQEFLHVMKRTSLLEANTQHMAGWQKKVKEAKANLVNAQKAFDASEAKMGVGQATKAKTEAKVEVSQVVNSGSAKSFSATQRSWNSTGSFSGGSMLMRASSAAQSSAAVPSEGRKLMRSATAGSVGIRRAPSVRSK